jgi:dTDP-4-dehydrorhamnose 3,5-epimerase
MVRYDCSATYDPASEHAIDPFDPGLAIPWGAIPEGVTPVASAKEASAHPLRQAAAQGLPQGDECVRFCPGAASSGWARADSTGRCECHE